MAWTPARHADHLTRRDASAAPLLAHAGLTRVWTPEEAATHKARALRQQAVTDGTSDLDAWFTTTAADLRRLCAARLAWWEVAEIDRRRLASPPEPAFSADTWRGVYRDLYGHLPPRHLLHASWVASVKAGLSNLPPHPDDTDLVAAWTKAKAALQRAWAAAQQETLPGFG